MIRGGVVLDVGASFGDSAVIFLKNYEPEQVLSFELTNDTQLSEKNYFSTILSNNVDPSRVKFIPFGVSSKTFTKNSFNFVSIDDYCDKFSNIKLIKADIEGFGFLAIQGAKEVIRRHKPILIFSIYHSPMEFFLIKPYIEKLNLGYSFKILNLNFSVSCEMETTLICIPPSLDNR
jgi:hypothetical protein